MDAVIGALMSDRGVSQPLYCSEITCEQDGERMSDVLPLIYIWNEDPKRGTCSISINGPIVGEILEAYLPRSAPEFPVLRDKIIEVIRETWPPTIMATCERAGTLPSVVFSKEAYLQISKGR